jgi:hypothetical protein
MFGVSLSALPYFCPAVSHVSAFCIYKKHCFQ